LSHEANWELVISEFVSYPVDGEQTRIII